MFYTPGRPSALVGAAYARGARLSTEQMADALLEAVRGLHLAHPELGPKPLLAKLREQQPDLAAGNKEAHNPTKWPTRTT